MPALARLALSALTAASVASAASRTTWQQEGKIKNPYAECAAYGLPAVDAIAGNYPPDWETASLQHKGALASDIAIFTKMNKSIPAIAPRGTRAGDWTGVVYDIAKDPDCWWTDTLCTTPKVAGIPDDITSCPEANTWGFTLDDGPNCSHNAYYDYLNDIQQKATMFFIGSNVLDWPLEAQRALADGHEICGHTWSHPYMTSMTNEQAFAELYYTKKAIKDVMGITVTCWRPPYGDVDDRIRYIANELGLRTIIWDNDTDDWDYTLMGIDKIKANYEKIMNGDYATHGTVVLTHEIDGETMELSQEFLPEMVSKFNVMPVGTCQNWTQPYGEGDKYQYPNYAQWMAGTRSVQLAAPTAPGKEVPFATGVVVTSSGLPAGASTIPVLTSATATAAAASGATATAASGSASGSTTKTKKSKTSTTAKSSPSKANAVAATSVASKAKAAATSVAASSGADKQAVGFAAVAVAGLAALFA